MRGKIKSLYGIYKKHGREAFLEAAKDYSCHVGTTVEGTLSEMESRWYDCSHQQTEAEKMVEDYNNGLTSLGSQSFGCLDMGQPTLKM